jgi:peptidoglycan/LPS O-acetylase OafA/YrhL
MKDDQSNTFRPQLKSLTLLCFFAAISAVLFQLQGTGTLVAGPWWQRNVSSFCVLSGFILAHTYAGSA